VARRGRTFFRDSNEEVHEMTTTSATRRPRPLASVRARLIGNTVFVAHGAQHFELSDVAGDVWRLANGSRTLDEIADEISAVYRVDEARARADVDDFAEQLVRAGLFEWADGA
jgi:hypothetical protein